MMLAEILRLASDKIRGPSSSQAEPFRISTEAHERIDKPRGNQPVTVGIDLEAQVRVAAAADEVHAQRHGPVTLLSVIERRDGRLGLLRAEAKSVPGPILEIGDTNRRSRFACGAREFVTRWNALGPAHHCAVGVGHVAATLEKIGALLGPEAVRVV